jgi:membrane-associated protease RseP (regulator of RpoE activity)
MGKRITGLTQWSDNMNEPLVHTAPKPELSPMQILKHAGLFLVTLATTTVAGMLWQNKTDLSDIAVGLPYAFTALFILTCHEFGHYFAARLHRVRTTLPFYIPLPPVPGMINFGTLGAVIRTREPIPGRVALFDIGIAGPIAGFIASIIILAVGFMTLPGEEFLLAIHPDYDFALGAAVSAEHGLSLRFGSTLLYDFMQSVFARPGAYVPPMSEMYHYPLLITGWFGLLVTALNLLPAGQLDGGHVTYAMFGSAQRFVGRITFALLLFFGGMGFLPSLLDLVGLTEMAIGLVDAIPGYEALFWPGWLFWAILIAVFIKIEHPPVPMDEELTPRRRMLGWFSFVMLVLSLSPAPIYIG